MSTMEDLDHLTAGCEEVVSWCSRWKSALLTDGSGRDRLLCATSNILVRINDEALVKFGLAVTASEAANQTYARERLAISKSKVSVPQVYGYFEHDSTDGRVGYLVMEYVHGRPPTDLPMDGFSDCVNLIATAVEIMSQLTSDQPGPVDGGEPRGTIWAPDLRAYETFTNKKGLERWFNRALQVEGARMDLAATPLSLCHLDLAARNIIVTENSTVYLLDWACAGFFPRTFEVWTLHSSMQSDAKFTKALLSALPELNESEQRLYDVIWKAYRLHMLHNWWVAVEGDPVLLFEILTTAQVYEIP